MRLKVVNEIPKHARGKEYRWPSGFGFTYPIASLIDKTEDVCATLIRWPGIFFFEPKLTGTVYITYPIECIVTFDVKEIEAPGALLWHTSQAYAQIYKYEKKYGVWGHDIGDLVYEGFTVHKNGTIEISIGS